MFKQCENYEISSDKCLLQIDFIYEQLAKTSWASERPKSVIDRSIEHSFCIGAYTNHEQIAFARIITDYATTFYLAELIVAESYRGQGIGKMILQTIIESDEFSSIVGVLGTADAHRLYEKFGFVKNHDRMMIRRPK